METALTYSSLRFEKGYNSDWLDEALVLFNLTEMKRSNREMVHQAFQASQVVISIWNDRQLIAVGRALTDFKMYSSIFDVVVHPEFQKMGFGRKLMTAILEPLQGTAVFLTSTFGNEAFYRTLGFRFHKTALALYPERFQETPYLYPQYQIPPELATFGEYSVHQATIADVGGCFALNEQLGYQSDLESFKKRLQILLRHPEHAVIVVKNRTQEIVGWAHLRVSLILEDENFAQLAALVVRESERSSGIGAKLLAVAEHWAKAQGMKQIRLNSSLKRERAHQFYLRNGYEYTKTSKSFKKVFSDV